MLEAVSPISPHVKRGQRRVSKLRNAGPEERRWCLRPKEE